MPNFFTRKGDDGTTGFLGNGRVSKSDALIETLGCLDEASAALGIVRAGDADPDAQKMILEIQRDLYKIMAEVAASAENKEKFQKLDDTRVAWLEGCIDHFSSMVEIPKEFILPGETPSAAAVSFARTVVRRAERRLVGLDSNPDKINPILLQYLNRLSSFCFVLELFESNRSGNKPTYSKGESPS
jgi:cob(I)alamin adenosyltransferase